MVSDLAYSARACVEQLHLFENGRQPHFFFYWMTTSIFENGRRPQLFENEMQPLFLKIEDNLIFQIKWKTTSQNST